MVYSNTIVYEAYEYVSSYHLLYFHFFEALNDASEVQKFPDLIFTSYHRHW